jgi:hypothetical protein
MFNGQIHQDQYVLYCLKNKRNGTFLEIGSNDYKFINNTYLLEKSYGWSGIMVEYDPVHLPYYQQHRQNSHHIIQDATTINFKNVFETLSFPNNIDYLQIDLEVNNRSTLATLENLDSQVMDEYKFATVTFEHDIYRGDYFNTRQASRDIFERRGYVRVFSDVADENSSFEDWYVHPDLVDMSIILPIQSDKSIRWEEIVKILSQ